MRAMLAALTATGALVAVAACKADAPAPSAPPRDTPRPAGSGAPPNRPTLMLLTTLPLVFGETFGIDEVESPALKALETRYRVLPVAVADARTLSQAKLLLMAHPLAQPAEALVDLDRWVRSGGRLLLLADPALDWHSDLPLGDWRRPPPAFADTGLLKHWGLRLDAPDDRGPMMRQLGGHEVMAVSPGSLFGKCAISRDRMVARCRIGSGQATVVADADFLNIDDLDGPIDKNLGGMLTELAALEKAGE
jgi:hypothetical protein